MDWANIERDVALRTESRNLRNIDFDSSTRSGKVTKLIDGILSSKLLLEDKPMKENQSSNYNESASHHFNPMLKTLMADLAELQSALRFQSSRIEQFDTSYTRYDHDVLQMKKNQDALFDRINHIEAGTQGKSTDVDVLELYNDVQLRLKRVESNVNGLEENSRVYNVQFATKDAFAKLLDTIFDQLKSLTATVELSRDQCTHASVLFDALASAFVMLNGDDSLHQLELVTSFSREINKDHLARILTDALIRSVDGSIQAHLKPAMSLMHSSLLELIDELRAKQDAAIQSMRGSFQQLARQVQEDRAASFLLPPQPTTQEVKLDEGFLADFKQMKEKMEALSEDNKSLRQSLESQSAILAGLVTSQETAKTLDAEALLKVKTQCETLEHDVFALKEEGKNVRVVAAAAQSLAEETSAQLQDTEERITVLNSEVHGKVEAVEGALSSRLEELDQIVATKADAGEVEALRVESKQHAAKIKTLEAAAATVVDLEALQGKVDVVSSDLNILQGDLSTMEKKHQGRLRVHDEDVVELRKLANENSDATGKLSKRFDLSESTAQSKLSNLSTELHHKIADSSEAVTRLSRRFDLLDADAQAKNVSLRETQSKVQSHAEVLSDLTRKLTLLDSSCSAQFSSVVSQQKSTQEEVVDFTAKVTRKLDLHEAEILSKFTIRNDRVDALLMQNQESISKLGDRIDLTEHKQLSAMEELSSELRGKVSGAVDLTAQLNRRLETYQTDLSGRLSATQTDMSTLNKATNDRINAVIKQSDANIDLLQTQFTSKHNDLAHRLASMGDSMGNLAQQQFDLSNLQEKQQIDFNSLSAELGSMRVKLEEKLSSAVGTLQNSLASHSKAHQSALAEEKYDLLQLTSRVALLEQLVRYGQDLEDQTIAAGASGFGSSQTQAGSPRAMAPRPADPDTRAKLVELKGLVDGVCADNASQRAEFEARLDAFKVGLAALRKQYEDEVEEIKEISQAQQRTVTRSEQIGKSLQSQIDILQVEVQSLGEEMERHQKAAATQAVEAAAAASASAAAPSSPARVLPLMNTTRGPPERTASMIITSPTQAASKEAADRSVKFSPSKLLKTHSASPVRTWLAKKLEADEAPPVTSPEPAVTKSAVPSKNVKEEEEVSDFDDAQSDEGSDVFPLSPGPRSAAKSTPQEAGGVSAFSPSSVNSPPARPKLSINTSSGVALAKGGIATPATPDSPWDDESESEATPGTKAAAEDDTSSVDSEVRKKVSPPKSTAAPATAEPAKIPGPSVASVYQSGLAAPVKSPVKLSGSLGRGRSSGPGFGGGNK